MINAYAGRERPRSWSFLAHHWELIIVSLGGRLHTMHKATCGIHADMRLVSDTPGSPFLGLVRLKGRAHGPCSAWSLGPR